jgi:iron complex outermembrane receptor protein
LIEGIGTYDRTFGDLDMTALLGYSYQETINEGFAQAGGDFVTDATGFDNLSFAQDFDNGLGTVGGFKSSTKLLAYFGRVNFVYQGTYFASATYRREGSSQFGENNKWGDFYAASLGAELANIFAIPQFSSLKARVSYGVTGGLPATPYLAQDILAPSGSVLVNGTFVQAFQPVQNPNPNLSFEVKREWNVGLDMIGLDGRLQATFDWYTRDTEDLLIPVNVPVPPNLVSQTTLNAGAFDNTGFEGTITWKDKYVGDDLEWESSLNFATFSTELTEFSVPFDDRSNVGSPGLNEEPVIRVEIGEEIGNIYGPVFTGVGENGAWQFADLNGNGVIENAPGGDDRTVLGNGLPDFNFGWANTFRYQGFELNFFFRGTFGHDMVNINRVFYEPPIQISTWNLLSTSQNLLNLVESPQYSSYQVEDADFLRLDNATIAKEWKNDDATFKKVRVYFTGQNLWTLTNYSGVDPEVRFADTGSVDNGGRSNTQNPDILSPGIDRRNTWFSTTTFTLGVNLTL